MTPTGNPDGLDPLSRLAIRHGTDKFGHHNYTPNYWQLFRDWQDRPLRMLEIGVGGYDHPDRGGESLAVWRDFFPKAQITGIDIAKKTLDLGPRVQILQGSQVDLDFLARLERERGPFDIILDDGSHRNDHVIATFEALFPGLSVPGFYVVEDTQTSFFPGFGGSADRSAPTMMNYFADLFIQLDHLEIDVHHQTGPHPIAASIATMQRFHNIVAITKGDNTYPSNFRFDARHPGVVAALGHIADAADADMPESGMLAYARLLRASDRPEQLDAVIAALTARKAESLAFYQLAARACLQRDRLDQAAELVRAGTARHGDDAVLLSIGAGIAQRQGDRKAAIGLLERALEIDPHLSGGVERLQRLQAGPKGRRRAADPPPLPWSRFKRLFDRRE